MPIQTSDGKWKWGNIEKDTKGELVKIVYGIWVANGKPGKFEDFWHYKGHGKVKTECFKYSFLSESVSDCDEHDLEWILGIINKAHEDIKKSDGSQEVFDAGANCIEALEKTISSSKLEGYSEDAKKFRKRVVRLLVDHIRHLQQLDVWGGLVDDNIWESVFSIRYITWFVNNSKRLAASKLK